MEDVMKTVTPKLQRNITCRKCEWNIRGSEQEEKLCDEVERVQELVTR